MVVRHEEASLLATPAILSQTPGLRVEWGSGAPVSPCVSTLWGTRECSEGKGVWMEEGSRGEHVLWGNTSKSLR